MPENLENSAVATGLEKISFHSSPKDNVQIFIQLRLFQMLPKLYSKSFKLGSNSRWTENFQIYKLDLQKAEEPEIKLPTFVGSQKKQENSRKTIVLFCWLC